MKKYYLFWLLLLGTWQCAFAWNQAEVTLAVGGNAQQVIVIPSNPSPTITATANELAGFLNQISGATFTISNGNGSTGIVLGKASDYPGQGFETAVSWISPMDNERYMILSEANRLVLVGATDLACRHAVYDFLRTLGCHMYLPNPNWYILPPQSILTANLFKTEVPDYKMRHMWGYQSIAPWAYYMSEWDKFNRRDSSYIIESGHSYSAIVTWATARGLWRPEYDSLIGGVRVPSSQFCISNPNLRQLVCDYAADYLATHPTLDCVSLEPNDGADWCQCANCAAMGSVTDRVVMLANQAAQATLAQYPNKFIGIYAYNMHSPPPTINVDPRIYVLVATGFINGGYTYEELIALWSAKASNLGMRDYFSIWASDHALPGSPYASNLGYLASRLPWNTANNVSAVSAEGTGNFGAHGLGYYIATQLLWDTTANVETLKSEFLSDCFGGAAQTMGEFYELLDRGNSPLMSEDYRGRLWRLLAQARDDIDIDDDGDDADNNLAVSRRLDDLCLWMGYAEIRCAWILETNSTAKQSLAETTLRHVWKMRATSLIDTYDCWRYTDCTHPIGYKWDSSPHPWKEDTTFTHADALAMMNQGVLDNDVLGIDRVTFNTDLKPSGLAPLTRSNAYTAIRGECNAYLYPKADGHLPALYISNGYTYNVYGDARWSLYDASGTLRESGTIPPDLTTYTVNFTTTGNGPFLFKYNDFASSSRFDYEVGGHVSLEASAAAPLLIGYRNNRAYFFVPKNTANILFYASTCSDFNLYDASGTRQFQDLTGGTWKNYVIPVPAGKDNQVWYFNNLNGSIHLLNCPPYLAHNADELVLPDGVKYNYAPVATNDAFAGLPNTALVIAAPGVLTNDSDQNQDWLSAAKVSDPAHGTVTLNDNGSFTYVPAAGYSGTDAFSYRAIDSSGGTSTATVTLTIQSMTTTGMKVWLKADAGVTKDGNNLVSTWADQSGNNNHAAQGTGANQPSWVADAGNGQPTVRFDGTTDFLRLPSPGVLGLVTSDQEFFVVAKTASPDARYMIASTASRYQMVLNSGSAALKYSPVSTGTAAIGAPYQYNGAFHLFAGRAIAGMATARVDGTDSTPVAISMAGLTDTTNLIIGSRYGTTYFWSGDIAEVLIYNRELTTTERQIVEQYLQRKYTSNALPVAVPDAYTLMMNTTLAQTAHGLLANDSDPDQDSICAAKVSDPSHGNVTVNADGSFTYVPATGYSGTDSFTYQAMDTFGRSAVTTVTLTILPGAKVWLKADAGVTKDGNNLVSTWADQSGNNNHAAQGTGANQPSWVADAGNGQPTVRFDGTTDFLRLPSPGVLGLVTSDQEFFVVAKTASPDARYMIASTAARYQMVLNSGSAALKYSPVSTGTAAIGAPYQYNGAFHLFAGRAIAGMATARVDGTDSTPVAISMAGLTDTTNLIVGSRYGTTYFWLGDIAEVLIYNRELTTTERTVIESYLTNKYGL